jgi:hypothetical protein
MQPLRAKWLGPLVGAITGVLIVTVAALGVTTMDGGSTTGTTTSGATTNGSTPGTTPQRGGPPGHDRGGDHAERHAQMEKAREAMDACLTERGVDVPERPEPGTRPEGPPPELDEATRAAIDACHDELERQGLAPEGGDHHGERGGRGPMHGHGGPMGDGPHGPGGGPRGGGQRYGQEPGAGMGGMRG